MKLNPHQQCVFKLSSGTAGWVMNRWQDKVVVVTGCLYYLLEMGAIYCQKKVSMVQSCHTAIITINSWCWHNALASSRSSQQAWQKTGLIANNLLLIEAAARLWACLQWLTSLHAGRVHLSMIVSILTWLPWDWGGVNVAKRDNILLDIFYFSRHCLAFQL